MILAKPKPNYRGPTNDFPAQVNYLGVLSLVRYAKIYAEKTHL